MSTRLFPLLIGLLLALGVTVAFAVSSPALFTTRIDHQTLCRRESRDFPLVVGNRTAEPMNVRVDTMHLTGQEEMAGGSLVSFDEALFVLDASEVRTVVATLAILRTQRPGEYATLLRFTNVTPPLSAAVAVWLRFEVQPWREGSKRCPMAP